MRDRPVKIGRGNSNRVLGALTWVRNTGRAANVSFVAGRVSPGWSSSSFRDSIAVCWQRCDYRLFCFAAWEGFSVPDYSEFDPMNRILRGRLEGAVTDELQQEFYGLAGEYFERTAARAGITDLSAVTFLEVSPQTIRDLASSPPAIQDRELRRFTVAAAPGIFGMARMFELGGQDTRPNLHVVRTMKEVCVILGITDPKFEPIPA